MAKQSVSYQDFGGTFENPNFSIQGADVKRKTLSEYLIIWLNVYKEANGITEKGISLETLNGFIKDELFLNKKDLTAEQLESILYKYDFIIGKTLKKLLSNIAPNEVRPSKVYITNAIKNYNKRAAKSGTKIDITIESAEKSLVMFCHKLLKEETYLTKHYDGLIDDETFKTLVAYIQEQFKDQNVTFTISEDGETVEVTTQKNTTKNTKILTKEEAIIRFSTYLQNVNDELYTRILLGRSELPLKEIQKSLKSLPQEIEKAYTDYYKDKNKKD